MFTTLLQTQAAGGGTNHALEGTITGVSTINASDLTVTHPLEGSIVGQSSISGKVTVTHSLEGSIVGQSNVFVTDLPVSHTLRGGITGQSNITGNMGITLAGSFAGQSAINGILTVAHSLEGLISATSLLNNASLLIAHSLNAPIDGQSTISGSIGRNFAIESLIVGQSVVSGDASVVSPPPEIAPAPPMTGKQQLLVNSRTAGIIKYFQPSSITNTKTFEKEKTFNSTVTVKKKVSV